MRHDLFQAASLLAPGAQAQALGLLTTLSKDYPILGDAIDPAFIKRWDFAVTAASVYCALRQLTGRVPADRFRELYPVPFDPKTSQLSNLEGSDSIASYLNELRDLWFSRGEYAVDNCAQFVRQAQSESALSQRDANADAYTVGFWVLLNAYEEKPEFAKVSDLASKIGIVIITTYATWWD